jgi:hypothetical protein
MNDAPENTGRNPDGRFAAGNRIRPEGKPKGVRHKATMVAEKIFAENLKDVADVVAREAKAGQNWACKLLIERILPPAREKPTPFRMLTISGPQDIPAAYVVLLCGAAVGDLTISEACRLGGLLDGLRSAFETATLASEIDAMRAEIAALRQAAAHPNGEARSWS